MNIDEIIAWLGGSRPAALSEGDAISLLSAAHPRVIFVKTLPFGASVLDLGADNGGLEVYRRWPAPERSDLRLYAYDAAKGEKFDAYDGFELGTWEASPPRFPGIQFDALISSHFIERLDDPAPLIEWAGRQLRARGRFYMQWPSPYAALLPKKAELAARGIDLTISNLHDDDRNKTVHDRTKVVSALSNAGFFVEQQGYVSLPFLEEEIPAHIRAGMRDGYALQSAYWSRTRWSQYVVAVRRS